eukprot:47209_1
MSVAFTRMLPKVYKQAAPKSYASCFTIQKRLRTYLVGLDGSSYGFSALKNVAQIAQANDKIVCMHFPMNIAPIYTPQTFDDGTLEVIEFENQERNQEIDEKCHEIVKDVGSKAKVVYECGSSTFSPGDDLVRACYKTKCDVLCLGSKGVSHGFKEVVSDKMHRVGHVADYCLHYAPCDVMVVKEEHDNVQLKE